NYITDDSGEPSFQLEQRNLAVTAPRPADTPPPDNLNSRHLVVNARGFENCKQARAFGAQFKNAVIVASALRQFGVDVGEDSPTGMIAQSVKDSFKAQRGVTLRDDVHGLDIFQDNEMVRIITVSAEAKVSTPAQIFFTQVGAVFEAGELPDKIIE